MRNNPTYIVFHHSELASPHSIKDVKLWHTSPKLRVGETPEPGKIYGNGWRDVGYHRFLRKDGSIEKGRDYETPGAHCWGYNRKSIGICIEGNMDFQNWTKEQTLSFMRLTKDLLARYPITIDRVRGHNECGSSKTCPGTNIDCERIRNLLRLYMYLN